MDFTNTPLAEPIPDDPVERVHRFARDLAWGATRGLWNAETIDRSSHGWGRDGAGDIRQIWLDYRPIWIIEGKAVTPPLSMLLSFGYLITRQFRETEIFTLTQKAFDLLAKPLLPPTVFISYRRTVSSALGLLLVSRLKVMGIPNPFIDMNIDPGDDWHAQLEKIVRSSHYFILLIGNTTLDSDYVREEIEWALDTPEMVIIPFLHDGVREDVLTAVGLGDKNAIVVQNESAEEYEIRVIKLLNRLGYTP